MIDRSGTRAWSGTCSGAREVEVVGAMVVDEGELDDVVEETIGEESVAPSSRYRRYRMQPRGRAEAPSPIVSFGGLLLPRPKKLTPATRSERAVLSLNQPPYLRLPLRSSRRNLSPGRACGPGGTDRSPSGPWLVVGRDPDFVTATERSEAAECRGGRADAGRSPQRNEVKRPSAVAVALTQVGPPTERSEAAGEGPVTNGDG